MVRCSRLSSGIYKIINSLTGKFYIGSAVNLKSRWRNHRFDLANGDHHNKHLQNAWNKYGSDAFVFEILEEVNLTELIQTEQLWIDATWATGMLYNISPVAGSNQGLRWKVSPEARARIRAGRQNMSQETKRKISVTLTGCKRSVETKKKMSEAAYRRTKDRPLCAVCQKSVHRMCNRFCSKSCSNIGSPRGVAK